VAAIPAIELAAARLLAGYAPESVLGESSSVDDLRRAQAEERLLVALDGDAPVGFALIERIAARRTHLAEIDVLPSHGRRGIGAALVHAVCAAAAGRGDAEVTLTTFRDVPWNMPFYARLGFVEIPRAECDEVLEAILRDEAARGLEPQRRVAMRLCLRPAEQRIPGVGAA
jgi:GNAT superfamily N-acetyltransferase